MLRFGYRAEQPSGALEGSTLVCAFVFALGGCSHVTTTNATGFASYVQNARSIPDAGTPQVKALGAESSGSTSAAPAVPLAWLDEEGSTVRLSPHDKVIIRRTDGVVAQVGAENLCVSREGWAEKGVDGTCATATPIARLEDISSIRTEKLDRAVVVLGVSFGTAIVAAVGVAAVIVGRVGSAGSSGSANSSASRSLSGGSVRAPARPAVSGTGSDNLARSNPSLDSNGRGSGRDARSFWLPVWVGLELMPRATVQIAPGSTPPSSPPAPAPPSPFPTEEQANGEWQPPRMQLDEDPPAPGAPPLDMRSAFTDAEIRRAQWQIVARGDVAPCLASDVCRMSGTATAGALFFNLFEVTAGARWERAEQVSRLLGNLSLGFHGEFSRWSWLALALRVQGASDFGSEHRLATSVGIRIQPVGLLWFGLHPLALTYVSSRTSDTPFLYAPSFELGGHF
jgi:hypothetical protein